MAHIKLTGVALTSPTTTLQVKATVSGAVGHGAVTVEVPTIVMSDQSVGVNGTVNATIEVTDSLDEDMGGVVLAKVNDPGGYFHTDWVGGNTTNDSGIAHITITGDKSINTSSLTISSGGESKTVNVEVTS
jgi:hypothetical protein